MIKSIHTIADVTRRSSLYHVPGARHSLLVHRNVIMRKARTVKMRDGMGADCARFTVASSDKTNQLGECMCILS
jgi:hypothetical protein